jgi:hypothetical protein
MLDSVNASATILTLALAQKGVLNPAEHPVCGLGAISLSVGRGSGTWVVRQRSPHRGVEIPFVGHSLFEALLRRRLYATQYQGT